jgi:hypothetical protein
MGFMLDRLGRDCAPLQFLRELTQNSIEAILKLPNQSGEIRWDVDWTQFDLKRDGVYKLAVIDTGIGMTGPEMVKYINQLSSSSTQQSHDGNFGVGAKIAAATRNHVGLIYLSWVNASGAMIHLWRDPRTGQYGLRRFEQPDGTFNDWLPIENSVKPELIGEHGTMVVLLGNDEAEHTMRAPLGTSSPSRWIAKYLNTRYFRFPDGVTLKTREGWENPRNDVDRNLLRHMVGQKAYLDDHAVAQGRVALSDAAAHWWVLREESALTQNSGFINSSGHVAALYRDELYEIETSRPGVARLQQFGVILGYNRVTIYVEPEARAAAELSTNTARTQLLINREPLPWADWAAEFRDNLPSEIRSVIEEAAAAVANRDHAQSIRERLKQIADLFRLSRYRPSPAGTFFVDDNVPRRGGKVRREGGGGRESGNEDSSGAGGREGNVYAVFATQAGDPALKIKADPFPSVMWVRVQDGTRQPGFLDDRAATYLKEQNLLQINGDFRVFHDMVERFCKLYSDVPGARSTIEEVVTEWFEQSLVEAVMGVQSLEGASEWSREDITRALSEEALTSAVMPRYHLDFAIRRSLGSKLGSLKPRAQQSQVGTAPAEM